MFRRGADRPARRRCRCPRLCHPLRAVRRGRTGERGGAPLRWSHPDAEGELPCYAVNVVDSTAAGDAFVGGLLCCLAELEAAADRIEHLIAELPRLHAMLRFAAACGALTVTRRGSFAAMPTSDEVPAFMAQQA
ncbi:PfkB family carbohydrate kinase [Rhodanobacter sp. AS-Z3]|uniref:PfkB family carbohydrate kinase n=1 Tax=Rhodanobacter sp. AS-Z3 TaxID=3031330 RepID=UPI002478BF67|nr:PfkB family carbohydrate kinase [Rhodanobacter sp. AS-Z3]WEN14858.1 PfkB family carbohydrate kinase [Rhodanobacter sp. AS-Z3]